jgi:hypothetical protein
MATRRGSKNEVNYLIDNWIHYILCSTQSSDQIIVKWCLLTLAQVDVQDMRINNDISDMYSDYTSAHVYTTSATIFKYLAKFNTAGILGETLTKPELENLLLQMYLQKYQ